jgi:hypothetical protein
MHKAFSPEALPRWLIAVGVVLSLALALLVPKDVFFSGDAGPKYQLSQQLATGNLHVDLRFDVEPWVRELWASGMLPFHPTSLYAVDGRYLMRWPVFFSFLTAPFSALAGFRGLLIIPTLALWVTWVVAFLLLRRLRVGPWASSLALVALIFASPLTAYGPLYWEHSLAVALSFAGFALIIAAGTTGQALAGGLLLGIATCFRLEAGVMSAVVVGLLWLYRPAREMETRTRAAATIGALTALVAFAAWNTALYHAPFGPRGGEALHDHPSAGSRLFRVALLGTLLAQSFPFIFAAGLCALLGLRSRDRQPLEWRVRMLLLGSVLFFLCASVIAPPDGGGLQIGPRYLLPLVPMACVWGAVVIRDLWSQKSNNLRWLGVAVVALAFARGGSELAFNGVAQTLTFLEEQKVPALELARRDPSHVVAISDAFIAQELSALMDRKAFLLVRSATDLRTLATAAFEHGQSQMLYLDWKKETTSPGVTISLSSAQGPFSLSLVPLGNHGLVSAYAARMTPDH